MKELLDEFDEERRQLARRLHATAAQQLAAVHMNLSLVANATSPERAARALQDASEIAQACAREIREVCNRLHPPLLDEVGLAAALRAFAAEQGCQLSGDFPEEIEAVPDHIALGAFRIVEQLVVDSETRASCSVSMTRHPDKLVLTVFGAGEIRASVRERIDMLRGDVCCFQTGGWRTVIVSLPLTS